jgi:hypothetical protein
MPRMKFRSDAFIAMSSTFSASAEMAAAAYRIAFIKLG